MKKVFLLLLLFPIFFNIVSAQVNVQDSLALVDLYNQCNGPDWHNNGNWLTGQLADWHGVYFEGTRVDSLALAENNLSGTLPVSFGDLSELRKLRISYNTLSDLSSLSACTNLAYLDISGNSLSSYDFLTQLLNLNTLKANNTGISDLSPISTSTNLIHLSLAGIPVTNVSALSSLTTLEYLSLEGTPFSDVSPLGGLTNLRTLHLNSCPNISNISSLSGLVQLESFYLSESALSDISVIENFVNLYSLLLSDTRVSSLTPLVNNTGIGQDDWLNLENLPLDQQSQEVEIPALMARGASVNWSVSAEGWHPPVNEQDSLALVDLYNQCNGPNWNNNDNWLTGRVVDWYGVQIEDMRVTSLELWNNNLTGTLPASLGNMSNLIRFIVSYNNLSDISNLSLCASIEELMISECNVGSYNFLADLTGLTYLAADNIGISDLSPVGFLSNLRHLDLGGNPITDVSPLNGLTSLFFIGLASTPFSDVSPLGGLSNLYGLDLRKCPNISDISSLSGLVQLESFYLTESELSDISVIEYLTNLSNLDLNNTRVSSLTPLVNNAGIGIYDWLSLENLPLDQQAQEVEIPALMARGANVNWSVSAEGWYPPVNEQDSLALVDLYNQCNGPDWVNDTNSGWLLSPVSMWDGITVENGRVIYCDLNRNNLTGALPAALGDLDSLQVLNLYGNALTDLSALSGLGAIKQLDVRDCGVTNISWVSGISSLERLELSENQITDISPLNSCPSPLKDLLIGLNPITDFSPIGSITSLETLSLGQQDVYTLNWISSLSNLRELSVNFTKIADLTPIQSLNSLENLMAGGNEITDISALEQLNALRYVQLGWNSISDIQALSGLPYLEHVWLNDNSIADLTPLVENADFNEGSYLNIEQNPLSNEAIQSQIPVLQGRGVAVDWSSGMSNQEACFPGDSLILVTLYNQCNGSNWNNQTNWLSSPVKDWYGITLENNRVVQIILENNGVSGTIPEDIGSLGALRVIAIQGGGLTGEIPDTIYSLSGLEVLHLSSNHLTGEISNRIGELNNLRSLGLAANQLSGPIPPEIGDCSSLDYIHIGQNNLSGALPAEIGNLTQLEVFNCILTGISGSIPESFGNLVNLRELYLDKNQLSGEIPAVLGNLTALEKLGLWENDFSGSLPASLGNLTHLTFLDVSTNNLSGPVPDLSSMTALTELWLWQNQFSGNLPEWVGNLPDLSILGLGYNSFTGPIPASYENLKGKVSMIFINDNHLSGSLPAWLAECDSLEWLYAYRNGFTGPIPNGIGSLQKLQRLALSFNELEGTLPADLWSAPNLQMVTFAYNNLSGQIPEAVGNASNLVLFSGGGNQFSGAIPAGFGNLTQLDRLLLNDNDLDGAVPTEITNLSALRELILNGNLLSGLPDLSSMANLTPEGLQVHHNALDFNDVRPNMSLMNDTNFMPQTLIPMAISYLERYEGEVLDLDATALMEYTPQGNSLEYRWYKDSIAVTIWSGSPVYHVPAMQEVNSGWYHCEIREAVMSNFSLSTEGIQVDMVIMPARMVDSLALAAFYFSSGGPGWDDQKGWLEGSMDSWGGVTLSESRVTGLSMADNGLSGNLPMDLSLLTKMEILDLSHNNFTGAWPVEFSNMKELSLLNLSNNPLQISMPEEIKDMTALEYLYLDSCGITGSLPLWLGDMALLRELTLEYNDLSGSIPLADESLPELRKLVLSSNSFDGSLPESLIACTNLQYLDISGNGFSGIPDLNACQIPRGNLIIKGNKIPLGNMVINQDLLTPESAMPQQEVLINKTYYTFGEGAPLTIDLSAEVTGEYIEAGQEYSWFKLDSMVGQRSQPDFTFSETGSEGIWFVEFRPVSAADFWLATESFEVAERYIPANVSDSLAMVSLYNQCGGVDWIRRDNWLSGKLSDWYGVKTYAGRVIELHLPENNLQGDLPAAVANLSELTVLDIKGNYLSGFSGILTASSTLRLSLEHNQLFFDDFVSANLQTGGYQSCTYSPQKYTALVDSLSRGDSILVFLHTQPAACTYEWYRNGELFSQTDTFSLRDQAQHHGIYTAVIDHPSFPELTIQSESFALGIDFESGVSKADYQALSSLYNALGGDQWRNKRYWMSEMPVSKWFGVEVSFGRVQSLSLNFNNLTGNLPSELGLLTELTYLSLFYNNIKGSLPQEIGSLSRLAYAKLSDNALSGNIPAVLGNLSDLEFLDLSENSFSGSIPVEIVNLSFLRTLYLHSNELEGAIPTSIGSLSLLAQFNLSGNHLEGVIPESLGNCTQLVNLNLKGNALDGSIPSGIGSLESLIYLNLSNNRLQGELPTVLGNLSDLRLLDVSYNSFEGAIPLEVLQIASLENAFLQFNHFNELPDLNQVSPDLNLNVAYNDLTYSGFLNSAFDPEQHANIFYSPQNMLSAPIVLEEDNRTKLIIPTDHGADVREWYMDGTLIPESNTDTLDLGMDANPAVYYCHLSSSSYPGLDLETQALGYGVNLQYGLFDIDYQALVDLYNSTNGDQWINNQNWFEGDAGSWYGVSVSGGAVTRLSLKNNRLDGKLPSGMGNLTSLQIADLSGNNICDSLPESFRQLSNLLRLDLSGNKLDYVPDLSSTYSSNVLRLQRNSLDFNSLEKNAGIMRYVYYSPQDSLKLTGQYFEKRIGEQFTLDIDKVLLDHPGGSSVLYVLYKDGSRVAETKDPVLLEAKIAADHQGSYEVQMSNSQVPRLKLESQAFFLKVLSPEVSAEDSLALVNFYYSTGGDEWSENEGWLSGPVYTWYGVSVDSMHVTGLMLPDNRLKGYIPQEIGDLPLLDSLLLSNNDLDSLGDLRGMRAETFIDVTYNNLVFEDFLNSGLNPEENEGLLYAPQNELEEPESSQSKGQIILRMTIPGEGLNYAWYKYGIVLERTYDTLLLSTEAEDYGIYTGEVTHDQFPELYLRTRPYGLGVNMSAGIEEADYAALVALYDSTGGEGWITADHWFEGNAGDWFGVETEYGRVVRIDLPDNNLEGKIPTPVNKLTDLVSFDIRNNRITELCDFTSSFDTSCLKVSENYLTFDCLEPNYDLIIPGRAFPQKAIPLINPQWEAEPGHAVLITLEELTGRGFKNAKNRYTWYKDGERVTDKTTFAGLYIDYFDSNDEGEYYCEITNRNIPGYILKTESFSLAMLLGINSMFAADFVLYPNPVHDVLHVKGSDIPDPFAICLYDQNGRIVEIREDVFESIDIPVRHLAPGLYYLKIKMKDAARVYTIMKY